MFMPSLMRVLQQHNNIFSLCWVRLPMIGLWLKLAWMKRLHACSGLYSTVQTAWHLSLMALCCTHKEADGARPSIPCSGIGRHDCSF